MASGVRRPAVNRINQRRVLEREAQKTLLPEPKTTHLEITADHVTAKIWWTDEERHKVAARVAYLRCKNHRESMADLIDQAQRSVLPRDRWRPATGFGADYATLKLAEEHGLKMAQWYERYDEIDQKLAAYQKLVRNEHDFVEILSKDSLSNTERERLMELLQPADILKHFRIEELISAASPQHLFTATIAKCLDGGTTLVSRLVNSIEQLNNTVVHAQVSGYNGHSNGHHTNGHHAPTAVGKILVYGLPDEHHVEQVRTAFPKAPLVFVEPTNLDPQLITADTYKIMVYFNTIPKRQKQLIDRRRLELKFPEDKIRKVPGGMAKFLEAIRRVLPA